MSSVSLQAMDTLNRKLTQARAVLLALEAAGEENGEFLLSHQTVMSTLWAARELVEQAQAAAGGLSSFG